MRIFRLRSQRIEDDFRIRQESGICFDPADPVGDIQRFSVAGDLAEVVFPASFRSAEQTDQRKIDLSAPGMSGKEIVVFILPQIVEEIRTVGKDDRIMRRTVSGE